MSNPNTQAPPPPPGFAPITSGQGSASPPPPPPGFTPVANQSSQPSSGQTPPAQPGQDEGFLSRAYETSGAKGLVDLGKAALYQRPIDLYHEMVSSAQKGDFKSAAESANKLLNGAVDPQNPIYKAAEQIIMQPIDTIKNEYKEQRAQGKTPMQAILAPGALKTGGQRVVSEFKNGHPLDAISSAIHTGTQALSAVPMVGAAADQIGGNLDTDIHNGNYRAALGDVAGPLATMGIGKVLGALGDAGEAAEGAEATTGQPPPPPPGGNALTRSADLMQDMNNRAPGPTAEATAQGVKDTVTAAKAPEQMANDAEAASQQKSITADQQAVQSNYERAHGAINQEGEAAQNAASQARDMAATEKETADESLKNYASMAPGDEAITAAAKTAADNANKAMHDNYVAQRGKLIEMAGDASVPLEDSPIHEAYNDLMTEGTKAAKGSIVVPTPPPGSARAISILDNIKNLVEPEAAEEGAEAPPPSTTTMSTLLDDYQMIGARQRATPWNTETGPADQQIYNRLKQGIVDTIGQVAEKSGNPDAIDIAQKMNSDYRNEVSLYQNPAVKALRAGKMRDVDAALTSNAQGNLGNVNALRQVLGSHWQDFTQNSLKRLVADNIGEDGTINYKGLLNKLGGMKADVRNAVYGQMQSGDILKSLNTATKAAGDIDTATADSEAAAKATQARLEGAGKTAAGKTKELQNASDNVTKEQAAKTKAINESIAGVVGDGDIAKLLTDPTRRAALQEAVGPDGMAKLGDLAVENQLSKATGEVRDGKFVKARFDPDKFLQWTESFKDSPEALDATFRSTPERAAAYDKLISSMQEASSVKKLVRFGVLPPIGATVGGLAGGPLVSVLATAASVLGEAKWAPLQEFLDTVANHPATWKTIGAVGKVADKTTQAAKTVAGAVPTAAKAAGTVLNKTPTAAKVATYGALAGALGGPQAEQQAQPNPQ